jgi:predicted nucleic acid-binding protein
VIALDSNLFIYLLEAHPEFGASSAELFKVIEKTYLNATTSELTLMEVLSHKTLNDHQVRTTRANLEKLGVDMTPISKQILLGAATLRRDCNLGALDSIHVATAIQNGCKWFITNDHNLLKRHVPGITLLPLTSATQSLT